MTERNHGFSQNCPKIEAWDKFICSPEPRDAAMVAHLKDCPFCRLLIDERKRNLAEFVAEFSMSNAFNKSLEHSASVIHLNEWLPEGTRPQPALLAAKTADRSTLQNSIVLASEDQSIVAKAVTDSQSGDLWVYFLGKPHEYQKILFQPFEAGEKFLADDQGRINLGQIEIEKLRTSQAKMFLPKAVFTLTQVTEFAIQGDEKTFVSKRGDKIKVRFSVEGNVRRIGIKVVDLVNVQPNSELNIAMRSIGHQKLTTVRLGETDEVVDEVTSTDTMEIYIFR
jgi:hypothetical protein